MTRTMPTTGFIHSIETAAAVDGPGMRFMLFMQGCMLRCWYCHNPDTWAMRQGREYTVQDVLDEVKPYKSFLKRAGGVTISGGEPLVQSEFVGEVLKELKALGLHTALDTQGYLHSKISDEWLQNVDLVLLDIKHIRPEKYHDLTGVNLQPTLDFAQRLSRLGKKMWIRYVLVPGVTDDPEDIRELGRFVATLEGVEQVEVLPFHKLGEHKWQALDLPYRLTDTPAAPSVLVEQTIGLLKASGLPVR
ncbi:pyruvate formate-lyase-activating protein [Deinococcus roseus]|uniref:Pyruvate formate-lyase-activating enzyme n=1 Tax=Deinococcus roseus TaxID=392414 RepID=A0ABQ2DE48_9DEIO|nr:pyruvate formate-lyase-activating protein [Deinococcus roseus]GGJ54528.1 pyruvate formate-lyase-activating enzyme [Deinococcus roseus]